MNIEHIMNEIHLERTSLTTSNFRSLVTVVITMRPSSVRGPTVTIGRLLLIRRLLFTHVTCS